MERPKRSRQDCEQRAIPTLHPVPCHRAQKVGIKALRLLNSVQDFADVHHLGEMRDKNDVTSLLRKPMVLHCCWECVIGQCWSLTERARQPGTLGIFGFWQRNFSAGLLSTIFTQLCEVLEMILKPCKAPVQQAVAAAHWQRSRSNPEDLGSGWECMRSGGWFFPWSKGKGVAAMSDSYST